MSLLDDIVQAYDPEGVFPDTSARMARAAIAVFADWIDARDKESDGDIDFIKFELRRMILVEGRGK